MFRVFTLSLLVAVSLSVFNLHLHDPTSPAKCLDGSPGALYVSPGDNSNIVIFFEGGGLCAGLNVSAMLQSCYQRSFTKLGSSKQYAPTINSQGGILSNSNTTNPHFWNWTKVYIPYCDGSFHQGSRREGVNYKNTTLFFRGSNNTLQHFKYLNSTIGLFNANQIIIGGSSAGGVASFLWANHLYDQSVTKKVYAVPDSGLFINDFPNPYTGRMDLLEAGKILVNFVNSEVDMPISNCVAALGENQECFQFSQYPQFQKAPLFIVESEYDQFSLANILTIRCLTKGSIGSYSLQKCNNTDRGFIENYRTKTIEAFNNFTSKLTNVGFWTPACVQHGFTHTSAFNNNHYRIPSETGITISEGIWNFISNVGNKTGNKHIDLDSWPKNGGCSSEQQFNLRGWWHNIISTQ